MSAVWEQQVQGSAAHQVIASVCSQGPRALGHLRHLSFDEVAEVALLLMQGQAEIEELRDELEGTTGEMHDAIGRADKAERLRQQEGQAHSEELVAVTCLMLELLEETGRIPRDHVQNQRVRVVSAYRAELLETTSRLIKDGRSWYDAARCALALAGTVTA